jgi:hypothetical protein
MRRHCQRNVLLVGEARAEVCPACRALRCVPVEVEVVAFPATSCRAVDRQTLWPAWPARRAGDGSWAAARPRVQGAECGRGGGRLPQAANGGAGAAASWSVRPGGGMLGSEEAARGGGR